MAGRRVVVIGAGIGGLVAALRLAHAGLDVTVVERAGKPGGKMRSVDAAGRHIEAGPTVFTMRWVFEEIFAEAGADLGSLVALTPAGILARHAWSGEARLDLFVDPRPASSDPHFRRRPRGRRLPPRSAPARPSVYRTLEGPFIRGAPAEPGRAWSRRVGLSGLGDLWRHPAVRDAVVGARRRTSATRGCGSSSGATPPIAAPRPSRRPRP